MISILIALRFASGLPAGPVRAVDPSSATSDCESLKVEMARAGHEIFLDPSPGVRAAATKRGSELLARLLAQPEWLAADHWGCLLEAANALSAQGDPDEVAATLEAVGTRLDAAGNRRASATIRRAAQELARPSQEPPAIPTIDMLVRENDCTIAKAGAKRMVSDLVKLPERLARIDYALSLPLESFACQDPATLHMDLIPTCSAPQCDDTPAERLRRWAEDLVFHDPDPRKWDITEVAHVFAARRTARFPLFSALKRMGWRRACLQMKPGGSVSIAFGDSSLTRGSEHFAFERNLYDAEWKESHPSWMADRDRWAEERWNETDDAAPHPDLTMLGRAIFVRQEEIGHEQNASPTVTVSPVEN